jgi:CHAD domain-containing protein
MSNPILTYFQKHRQIIEENLRLCRDPLDIEAIHNLRLSVKRIRVVIRLTAMIKPGSFYVSTQVIEINKLFKQSGRLRDTQVTRQLLVEEHKQGFELLLANLDRREAKQRKNFEQVLEVFNPETFGEIETHLSNGLEGVSAQASLFAGLQLLTNMELDVHEIFHGSTKEKRLHDIRTKLKDINYLNNIFEGRLPVEDQMRIPVERLRELGEIAGSWHDSLNLEKNLKKFIRKHPENSEVLQTAVKELSARKQGLSQEYVCILLNEMKV